MATGLRCGEQLERQNPGTTQEAHKPLREEKRGLWVSLGRGLACEDVQMRGASGQRQWVTEHVLVPSPFHPGVGLSQGSVAWHTGDSLAEGSCLPRQEKVTCSPGRRCTLSLAAYNYTPSPLHHHISMSPLHLLPKYHRIPVIVNIQHLTQT